MIFGINTTVIFQNCLKFHEPLRITILKHHLWGFMPNITINHAITYTYISLWGNFSNLIGFNRAVVFQLNLKYLHVKIANLLWVVEKQIIAWFVCDIWHDFHQWYFKIVTNFTYLTAREISYNNFEISLLLFACMPNITTNHAITNTK